MDESSEAVARNGDANGSSWPVADAGKVDGGDVSMRRSHCDERLAGMCGIIEQHIDVVFLGQIPGFALF